MSQFKKKFYLGISLFIYIFYHSWYASDIDYKSNIIIWGDIQEYNISYNIQKAKLLKNYVDTLEREIQNFTSDYFIKSEALASRAFELRIISGALNKIQTSQVEKIHAEKVLESAILKLKSMRQEIRTILKKELNLGMEKMKNLKIKRSANAQKISQRFISFIKKFTPKVREIRNLKKRKLILSSLTNINIEASKLALFESKKFTSPKQLEASYTNSLRSIKRELTTIKAIILN